MEKMSGESIDCLFAAGAYSAAMEKGMSEKDAEAFAVEVCKQAAARKVRWDEDEEDEGDTWWSRNKHWALPTLVGTGAFLVGADAGRNGRYDRSHLSNAGSLLYRRLRSLLGLPNDPWYRSLVYTKD